MICCGRVPLSCSVREARGVMPSVSKQKKGLNSRWAL